MPLDNALALQLSNIILILRCGECASDFRISYLDAKDRLDADELITLSSKIIQTIESAGMSVVEFTRDSEVELCLAVVHALTCCEGCESDRKERGKRRALRKKRNLKAQSTALLVVAEEKIPPRYREAPPADDLPLTDSGILLGGLPGRGKTFLAASYAKRWVIEKRTTDFIFISVPELLQEIKNEFNEPRDGSPSIIQRCQRAGLVILDDLGVEKHSEWSLESVYLVISYRYDNLLPTIITSNLTLSEIDDQVSQRIGSRLASFQPVELQGKDRRA